MNLEKFFYDKIQKNRTNKMLADREVISLKLIEKGDIAIDLGCGDGLLVKYAEQFFKNCYGFDISLNGIKNIKNIDNRGIQMNLNTGIALRSNSVDTIFLLDVIEHIFDPEFIVSEINRVLKKNGKLYISTPNMRQLNRIFSIIKGNFPKTSDDPGWDGGHIHYFCSKDIIKLLKKNKFRIINRTGILPKSDSYYKQKIKNILKKSLPQIIVNEFIASAIFVKAEKL